MSANTLPSKPFTLPGELDQPIWAIISREGTFGPMYYDGARKIIVDRHASDPGAAVITLAAAQRFTRRPKVGQGPAA